MQTPTQTQTQTQTETHQSVLTPFEQKLKQNNMEKLQDKELAREKIEKKRRAQYRRNLDRFCMARMIEAREGTPWIEVIADLDSSEKNTKAAMNRRVKKMRDAVTAERFM